MSFTMNDAFVEAARTYIAWVEGRRHDLRALHVILARLQFAAASLPDVETDDEPVAGPPDTRPAYADIVSTFADLPIDRYIMMFAPLEADAQPVQGSLPDDLADIYLDLLDGFRYFEAGQAREAAWHWRFEYYSHWGRHLAHAQTAIWQYLADGVG
jgi:hypothetical protein